MKLSKRILAAAIPVALVVGVVTPVTSSAADSEISVLIDNGSSNQAVFAALVAAYQKANPTVKVTVNLRPGGADGDNLVKTKQQAKWKMSSSTTQVHSSRPLLHQRIFMT
jgi:raffinose/stachyose/melibiose transport system substrate-binding protein